MNILVVDDDPDVLRTLSTHLAHRGHSVDSATNGRLALETLERQLADVVITDIRMPELGGLELLAQVRERWPGLDVIVVTAFGDLENAVEALRGGAFDFLTKPIRVQEITAALERTERFRALRSENERYRQRMDRLGAEGRERYGLEQIIGDSDAIRRVKDLIRQVAATDATTVLITGETGTGKELVARAIHYESDRAGGPFATMNCSAIPGTLIESELFGHARGAFTDAYSDREGRFEFADGGTLFLDEVGDLALDLQPRMLRVLEERRVTRVGESKERAVNVRVISATNADLEAAVAGGAFRPDLFYRLNTFTVPVPPLRERPQDILLLAQHFLRQFAGELKKDIDRLTPAAVDRLGSHPFPGNVRELRNIVERAVILCPGDEIDAAQIDLAAPARRAPPPSEPEPATATPMTLDDLEAQAIRQALQQTGGNKAQAARQLGITRDSLRRRLERHGLDSG